VFLDPMRADLDASRPEDDGMRHKTAGRIRKGLFIAVYTMRNGVIRMISARRTNSRIASRATVRFTLGPNNPPRLTPEQGARRAA
jgi:uncharacterized DUF497 family protein